MKIAYNPKTAAVITTATAANDDILFDLNARKVWAKGIRIGADWADISSKPSSLKNPYALTISLNGTSQGPYDGSAAKNINITPSSIGAATSGHNHDGRYVYNYGGTQMDANSLNKNALGMSNNSGITGDWWHILQAGWNNEYRWNSQIAFPTRNRNGMYYRSGLDDNTAWGDWVKLLDVSNSYVNSGKGYINDTEITQVNNASKLQTARNLWGNSFDGTKDINDSIIFPNIGDTAISNKISWSGSSDGADIYYQTTGKDAGNLVLNVKDDTNAYIQLALNGVFKSHFDVANSYWTGRSALADKWTTARTFTIGNTAKNVDGSGNVSWSLAEIGVKDTWRTVQVNGTSIGNNTLNLCGSTYIGLTNVNGKVTFSLVGSGATANQVILSNGTANGWTLKTLNIANWDTAYNLRHSHANKSVLDGITSGLVTNWNTAYTFVSTITGTDADNIINKWEEIVNFLVGITEDNKLNTLLNSKLSVYELANNTNVGAIKNNGIYYSTTDVSSGSLTNSPFNTGFALINMTSYDGGDDLRRSRLAFNAYGEIKISDDRYQANTAETWYNVLTSKNSGIDGSTIKLNGTSITVYSSTTADGRYVKKTGDTMSGALNFANNAWNNVGDDVAIGDHNVAGCLGIKGLTAGPGLAFYNSSNTLLSKLVGTTNQFQRVSGNNTYNILDNSTTHINNNTITINGTSLTVSKSDHNHDDRYVRKWIGIKGSAVNKFLKLTTDIEKGWIRLEVSESSNGLTGGYGIYMIGWGYHGETNQSANLVVKCLYANNSHYNTALKVVETSRNNYDFYFQFAGVASLSGYTINYCDGVSIDCTVTSVSTIPTTTYTSSLAALQLNASQVDWSGITNKPSAFNPAEHTHTVFKNNLMIKGTNGISNSASIHLGIGDSDTGFKWISDGRCQIYANNSAVGEWTSGGMNWFKNPTVNGNKVWNAGNDGSGSGLDADTVDGIDSSGFLRYYNSNTALSNVDIVNTPSYVWTVSTTGGNIANVTKPSGIDNAWGVIHLHTHIGNYATQLGFGGATNRMYMRNAHNTSTFGNWQALAFITDIPASLPANGGNSDTVDGYHANGLLTALSNSNNGISITVGGTTKSITNISVNHANSAGSATNVIVSQHTTNDTNYPLVWSNQGNTNNATANQLFKSWDDLYYNPKNKRLFVKGSVNTANINATGKVTSTGFVHSSVTKNANQYVLTAGGGYTFLNQTSNELAHEFSKDITVTSEWTDIEDFYGGNQNFLTQPGTYIVQVYYTTNSANSMYEGYFSGIMSWFTGTTNSNNADEIVLHRVGHAYANTIYLRTRESLQSETNPYTKLQISANTALKQHTYKFKFKRIC